MNFPRWWSTASEAEQLRVSCILCKEHYADFPCPKCKAVTPQVELAEYYKQKDWNGVIYRVLKCLPCDTVWAHLDAYPTRHEELCEWRHWPKK